MASQENEREGSGYTALLHTVNEIGIHQAIIINHLVEPSLKEVLALDTIQRGHDSYKGLGNLSGLAWIDFHGRTKGKDWLEEMERNTYLPLHEHAKNEEDFVSAIVIVASILHARAAAEPSRRLPETHKKYIDNVKPDISMAKLPPYIAAWLPAFLRLDRPHPPMLANRTDAIRNIASLRTI